MKNVLFLSTIVLLLTACPAKFVKPQIIEVSIPVSVPCFETMPTKPKFITNDELLAMNGGNFVYALGADRLARMSYEAELEALLIGCVK